MDFLTEKQLRNLTTERLNALRKTVLKARASAEYNADQDPSSQADKERARGLIEYYELIKSVMDDREHIERSPKPKQKGHNRDSIKRMTWE